MHIKQTYPHIILGNKVNAMIMMIIISNVIYSARNCGKNFTHIILLKTHDNPMEIQLIIDLHFTMKKLRHRKN